MSHESTLTTDILRFRIVRSLGGAVLCAVVPRCDQMSAPDMTPSVLCDPATEALRRMAARVVSLSRRVPSAAAEGAGLLCDDECVVFAPEELQLLDAAGVIVAECRMGVSPTADCCVCPNAPQPLRAAAYRWLLEHRDVIPRCDAAGFGADFLCYRSTGTHACALVWVIDSCPGGVSELPAHRAIGYKRLAQTVRKEAWLLLHRSDTFECHVL